jgi:predicted RNA-binding Zn-ribbon protein involved in translation (DUF1610 family)
VLKLRQNNSNSVLAQVTGLQFTALVKYVEDAYKSSNYRNVKDNPQWRSVYGAEELNHLYISKQHGPLAKPEPSVACRSCGIVLPLKVMTVDHQSPQTGGEIGAICRVFRGLGLTKAGPKGKKNKAAIQANAAAVGGKVVEQTGTWSDRYTFNDVGTLYYSVMKGANQTAALADKCLHHFLNLRPVCGPCNSRLKNSGAF